MSNGETFVDRVFEVSWEVCNKVGGINTVIKSKAPFMVDLYSTDRFTMIGPYIKEKAEVDLHENPVPKRLQELFKKMQAKGLECHYGTWSIRGEPETILIDFKSIIGQKNQFKKALWEDHKIDSLSAHWDFDEPMLFSTAAGMLIDEYQRLTNEQHIVAQFHEWLSGFGLLYLKKQGSPVATVFTTHATMLGRSIAGSGYPLYAQLESMNPDEWAYKLGIQDKFTTERACAHACDCFTTVSEITGIEAEKLLGRKPDVLLYNGLSVKKFPTVEETSIKHVHSRDKIREFIAYYFFPYYTFDIDHTLVFFITARFEFKNKGLDILIEALARLNAKLREQNNPRTVCVFFWIPMGTAGVKPEIIESKNFYYHIKNYVDWHAQEILKHITFEFLIRGTGEDGEHHYGPGKKPGASRIFSTEFISDIRRDLQHFKRSGNPPIATHELYDQDQNPLYQGLLHAGLDNNPGNKVKVIMYPAYLDGADSLLNLPYYEAIVGAHLGVFPSYYEPWGYTPLEAAELAVPAITTDLAGFGRYVKQQHLEKQKGVFVQPRFGKSREEEIDGLFKLLYRYANYDHVERVEHRLAAKNIAGLADWKHFVKYYTRAHKFALEQKKRA